MKAGALYPSGSCLLEMRRGRENGHPGKGEVRAAPVQILTPHTCPEGSAPDLEEEDRTELHTAQEGNQRLPIDLDKLCSASQTQPPAMCGTGKELEPEVAKDP